MSLETSGTKWAVGVAWLNGRVGSGGTGSGSDTVNHPPTHPPTSRPTSPPTHPSTHPPTHPFHAMPMTHMDAANRTPVAMLGLEEEARRLAGLEDKAEDLADDHLVRVRAS